MDSPQQDGAVADFSGVSETMDAIDTIVTTLLICLALWPLCATVLARAGRRAQLPFHLGLMVVVGAVVWTVDSLRPAAQSEAEISHRPIQTPTDGYVTSQTCRSCHPRFHATWHGSYHSKMTQVATPESVAGDFRDVELYHRQSRYFLSQRGDNFFVDILPADGGKQQRRQIVMTTGSHHRQWVWMETGDTRKIEPLPFLYLIPQRRWIPLESSFLVPPGMDLGFRKGAWNENCIQCHTTQGRMRRYKSARGDVTMDTRVGEFGIACEACHGPAEQHVLANRDPRRRHRLRTTGAADPTIVNPARLTPELSAHICGQCHAALTLYKSRNRQTYNRWNTTGFAYRPGSDLKNSRYLVGYDPHMNSPLLQRLMEEQPDYLPNRFWSDGVIRVAGREFSGLLKTPCYTHGDPARQMSCLSCHAMHPAAEDTRALRTWADDQLKPHMMGNHACTQCHEELSDAEQLREHTHHSVSSSGSLCYSCHMPYTTFGLLKAIRSHALVSPSVQSSLATGRPNACNQCHLDRTLAWTAEHLRGWYQIPVPKLSRDEVDIAASVLWTLQGDAGQRALMAWSMGWKDAQEISGTDWLTPYLAELLEDPYDAVRFVAHESLKRLNASSAIPYDFLAPAPARAAAAATLRSQWKQRSGRSSVPRPAVLLDEQGQIRRQDVKRLLQARDHRRVNLQE